MKLITFFFCVGSNLVMGEEQKFALHIILVITEIFTQQKQKKKKKTPKQFPNNNYGVLNANIIYVN